MEVGKILPMPSLLVMQSDIMLCLVPVSLTVGFRGSALRNNSNALVYSVSPWVGFCFAVERKCELSKLEFRETQ